MVLKMTIKAQRTRSQLRHRRQRRKLPRYPEQGETVNGQDGADQADGSAAQEEKTFTGIVSQVKQGMLITVAKEDDSAAYTFGLEGDVTAKDGDKVKVTYKGGNLEDMEGNLVATKIEVLK